MSQLSLASVCRLTGAGRILAGVLAFALPRPAAGLFGLPEEDLNPTAVLLARIAGDRDITLGAALAFAPSSQVRRMLAFGAATDAADVIASLLALREGLPRRAALASTASAAAYTALELYLLRRLRSAPARDS